MGPAFFCRRHHAYTHDWARKTASGFSLKNQICWRIAPASFFLQPWCCGPGCLLLPTKWAREHGVCSFEFFFACFIRRHRDLRFVFGQLVFWFVVSLHRWWGARFCRTLDTCKNASSMPSPFSVHIPKYVSILSLLTLISLHCQERKVFWSLQLKHSPAERNEPHCTPML